MGDHRRRGLAIAIAVAAGVLVTGGGLAVASKKPAKTVAPAADGTITACARKQDGRMRLVADASKCTKREQAVTWNQKGPGGDAGAPGDVVVGSLTVGGTVVPIHAFSFGATSPTIISGGGGSGAGAGKVKVADVEVLKDIDATTLVTTGDLFRGEREPSVLVTLFEPGSATAVRATYNFQNVFFTGTQQFSAGALDRVTFTFQKIAITIGADPPFTFDVATNK